MREFWRYHSFKVILGLVVLQLVFFSWLQYRNHRPEAFTDEYSVYEGQSVTCQPLRNDTDKDDEDEIVLHEVEPPLKGKVDTSDNKLVYSAVMGFAGVDSFAYTVFDGKKKSKKAFIKITVEENLKPVAQNDAVQLYQGQEISLAVLGNDEDREGDSIFLSEFSQPLHGELTQKGNKLIYKPTNIAARSDSFHYSISDGFNESDKTPVVLSIKGKNNACYPWLSADIGNPAMEGSLRCSNKKYELKAAGNDIWNNADNFHFAYQLIEGDCEIVAKVSHLENTNEWAKAGLMFRESLSGNSRNIFVTLTAENGSTVQIRNNPGSSTSSPANEAEVKAPYWLKLVKEKGSFSASISSNGKNWKELLAEAAPMPPELYVGLALTSHDDNKIATAKFENVRITRK